MLKAFQSHKKLLLTYKRKRIKIIFDCPYPKELRKFEDSEVVFLVSLRMSLFPAGNEVYCKSIESSLPA